MTTRKTPAAAPRPARSPRKARKVPSPAGRKVERPAVRQYPPEVRARALVVIGEAGIAAAHRETGVAKSTLTRWAKAEGVDVPAGDRARTANATEAVRARAAVVRASTVELLETHIAQAGDYLTTVAGVNALAARYIANLDPDQITVTQTLTGTILTLDDQAAADLAKVAAALDTLPLAVRDAEGLVTRAVHDLQLLRGEATERGELVVEFNVPRANPSATVVVDVPVLP